MAQRNAQTHAKDIQAGGKVQSIPFGSVQSIPFGSAVSRPLASPAWLFRTLGPCQMMTTFVLMGSAAQVTVL